MRYELKKLLSLRFFLCFLLLLLLTNGVLAYLNAPKDRHFQSAVETFFRDYEKDPAAYDEKYSAYLTAKTLAVEKQIEAAQNGEDPMAYAFIEPYTLYPASGYSDGELYTALYARKGYPAEYVSRLEEVIAAAEKNLEVVTDPYMQAYLAKVIGTYRPMTALTPATDFLCGWDVFLDYRGTEYLLLAAVLVSAMLLASADREEGTEGVLFATRKGFRGVLLQKISALCILCLTGTVLMEVSALAGTVLATPMEGLDAFLQSFRSYAFCPYPLYVWEAILLRTFLRVAALFAVGILFLLMARLITNRFLFLLASFGFLLLQTWWNAPGMSAAGAPAKVLNLLAILSGEDVLRRYTAVDLFGVCVPAAIAVPGVLLTVAILALCLLFPLWRKKTLRTRLPVAKKTFCYLPKTLFGFEAKKLFFKTGLILPILLLLAVKLLLPAPPLTYRDRIYRSYMEELEGELTAEKEAFLAEERTRFLELFAKEGEYTAMYEAGEITYAQLSALQMEVHSARVKYEVFIEIEAEAKRVKELNANSVAAELLYPKGWGALLSGDTDALFLLLLLLPSFAYTLEDRFHFRAVQNASPKGKRITLITKLLLCFSTTAGVGLAFFLIDLQKLSATHTLPLPGAVLASLPGVGSGVLPLWGCVCVLLLVRVLFCLGISAAGVLLSRRFRHPVVAPLLTSLPLLLIYLSDLL